MPLGRQRASSARPTRAKALGLWARALAAVLAFAWLDASALAGASWLYCAAMDATRSHCCCPSLDDDGASAEAPATLRAACCEARTAAALPDASGPPSFAADAFFVATVPAPFATVPSAHPHALRALRRRPAHAPLGFTTARAGPRRKHALHSVYLV